MKVTGTEEVKELRAQDLCKLSLPILGFTRMMVVSGVVGGGERKTNQMSKFLVKLKP